MPFAALAVAVSNGTVLVAITVVVAPIAAIAFARSGGAWKALGKGPLAIDQDLPPSSHGPPPRLDPAEQEQEVRQMLEAKAARLRSRGEVPIDVEAETARLLAGVPTSPGEDAELRAEVRQLVVIRNERRIRQGLEPLDIAAETDRQLEDFIGSGR